MRKKLNSLLMEIDREMCIGKIRYQLQKGNMVKEEEDDEETTVKRLNLTRDEEEDL